MLDPKLAAAVNHAVHGHVLQVEPVAELMSGAYGAVTQAGEFFTNTVLGLGVAEACDGEVISVKGETWRIPADGLPQRAPADLGLAFAVSATGGEPITIPVTSPTDWNALDAVVAECAAHSAVAAMQIEGDFRDVLLRSEARQEPPYPTLPEVLAHEVQFPFAEWSGTMVGFRFPTAEGTIPGFHLHAISTDRKSGGHCHHATLVSGLISMWLDDVHIGLEHHR